MNVAVVGGGISGLAASFRLLELSREKKVPIHLTLLESSDRVGGAIRTVQKEGCILELGPDALFLEKPWVRDLSKRLGLENEWIGTNQELRLSFIERKGKLYPIPTGFYLLAPSQIVPLWTTPLFSLRGKLRIFSEIFIPSKKNSGDEGFGSFVERRFGRELWERVAQPILSAIYSGDSRNLSLDATFPNFLKWEREFGSVIRGLQKTRKKGSEKSPRGPRYSLFGTFSQGLQRLVEKLEESLPDSTIQLRREIQEAEPLPSNRWRLKGEGFQMEVDALILSLPTHQSAKVLRSYYPNLSSELEKIEYNSVLTVNSIWHRNDILHPLNGFGFVVPESKRFIHGCTFSTTKFPEHGSKEWVVLRAFIGGKNYTSTETWSDEQVTAQVLNELGELLQIKNSPIYTLLHRHHKSLPDYRCGHLEIVSRIEEQLRSIPTLALAGNGFRGVGIPDSVHSGELAAEHLFSQNSRI